MTESKLNAPDAADRLTRLEELIAHLERTQENLSQVLIEQQKRLEILEASLGRHLEEWSSHLEETRTPRSPLDEKPPHY